MKLARRFRRLVRWRREGEISDDEYLKKLNEIGKEILRWLEEISAAIRSYRAERASGKPLAVGPKEAS